MSDIFARPSAAIKALNHRLSYLERREGEARIVGNPNSYYSSETAALRTAIREISKIVHINANPNFIHGDGI